MEFKNYFETKTTTYKLKIWKYDSNLKREITKQRKKLKNNSLQIKKTQSDKNILYVKNYISIKFLNMYLKLNIVLKII